MDLDKAHGSTLVETFQLLFGVATLHFYLFRPCRDSKYQCHDFDMMSLLESRLWNCVFNVAAWF